MYIHSYQIHNVLNVYRKQLSQGSGGKGPRKAAIASTKDRINISTNTQRQSIIDQVSSDIVDRIAQAGSQKSFTDALAKHLQSPSEEIANRPQSKETEFTYSVIDENNKKTTNTMSVDYFNPLVGDHAEEAQDSTE